MKKILSNIKITKQDLLIGAATLAGMLLTSWATNAKADKEEKARQEEIQKLIQDEVSKQIAER